MLNALIDSIHDIVFFKDVKGVYLGCNHHFVEFVGRTRDEIVGKTDHSLFDKKIADLFRDSDQRMLKLCEPRHIEEWITYPDGHKKLIDTLKTPYRGPDGALIGILGISRDITARRLAEESLRASEESYRNQFERNSAVMLLVDPSNGRIIDANAAALRFYGYSHDRLLAMQISEINMLPVPDIMRFMGNTLQELNRQFLFPHRLADGSVRDVEVSSSLIQFGGRPVLHSIVHDITERRNMEKALQESEHNFRTFFGTIDDLIVVATPEGRILFANKALESKLGYSTEELTAMHVLDLHPASSRPEAEALFAAMFRGERENCPLPMATRDGTLLPVETRVWFGKWNGSDCIFGVSKDLSAEQESQQRFERLFRNNPSLMALSTLPDRRFADVNNAFLKTLGYTREDVIGKTSLELGVFVNPEEQSAATNALLADGHVSDCEMQVRRKDGLILHGLFSGELIRSHERQFLLTVMIDISARKRSEAELTRLSNIQQELMHLATHFVNVPLENQNAAIDQSLKTMGQLIRADRAYLFAYDFANEITSNTHEWCRSGITPEIGNLQGVPTTMLPDWVKAHRQGELLHIPSVAALPESFLRQMLQSQGIRSLITLPLMQGTACLGFVGFDAVHDERVWQEEEVSILRVLAELYAHFESRRAAERETKELQKRLTHARDAAQEAARAKSLFLANMSHEIRTPLNAILGYAQIMEDECRNCPTCRRLTGITRGGEHLLELITDLLELVRADTRLIPLAPSDFALHEVLEDVRLMFVQRTETQGVALDVAISPEVPHFICADKGKVRQALVNLVGNAVKFTEKGFVRLTASAQAGGAEGGITIAVDVEDTGCGIRHDEQARIFDLFEQAESGRKSGKGTGLGLPLSRRFAQALGGDITVASNPGQGSRFRFTFTARTAGVASAPPRHESAPRLAPGQRAYRILTVDDDPSNLDMLSILLKAVGFAVETAASAAEALLRLPAGGIDMVLMDNRMPDMDGFEATRLIRKQAGGRDLPVLIVTASGFADEKSQAIAAGADACISKPVRRKQLLEEIGRIAGLRFDLEPTPPIAPAATPHPAGNRETLADLRVEQLQALDQALRRGDIRLLRLQVEAIARDHVGLAAELRALVDSYGYDRLRQLVNTAKGNAS